MKPVLNLPGCAAFAFSLAMAATTPASLADTHAKSGQPATEAAVAAAHEVMQAFLRAFNAKDTAAWADTLLFPHVRVAGGGVVVTPDKQSFIDAMDMEQFARTFDWGHSEWDGIELIQAGPDKVHFKVRFSRFNPAGERNATFDSLYIIQREGERWGVRARSSFAP